MVKNDRNYCNRITKKVVDKGTQNGGKPAKKKKHKKMAQNSEKLHNNEDQGMIKYGTPPEEVHPEAQK